MKTFYKLIKADIVQYFDFVKIVFRACFTPDLTRAETKIIWIQNENIDVAKKTKNICFKYERFKPLFLGQTIDVSDIVTVLEKGEDTVWQYACNGF